jgi:hypothetical protein
MPRHLNQTFVLAWVLENRQAFAAHVEVEFLFRARFRALGGIGNSLRRATASACGEFSSRRIREFLHPVGTIALLRFAPSRCPLVLTPISRQGRIRDVSVRVLRRMSFIGEDRAAGYVIMPLRLGSEHSILYVERRV